MDYGFFFVRFTPGQSRAAVSQCFLSMWQLAAALYLTCRYKSGINSSCDLARKLKRWKWDHGDPMRWCQPVQACSLWGQDHGEILGVAFQSEGPTQTVSTCLQCCKKQTQKRTLTACLTNASTTHSYTRRSAIKTDLLELQRRSE